MAGDQLDLLRGLAQHGGGPARHVFVAGAVEAVAADLVLLIIGVGQGVHVGLGGHGLVEGGVEHGHHGHAGHHLLAGPDAGEVGGVVEGGQGDAVLNGFEHLVGDQDRLVERLAAVDHPVAHRLDLLHGAHHAVFAVHQGVQHGLNGLGVGGHGHVHGVQSCLALHLGLVGELAVDADALAQALGQQAAGLGIQQLVFQRRAARVDYQNVHCQSTPLFYSFGERACRIFHFWYNDHIYDFIIAGFFSDTTLYFYRSVIFLSSF